MADCRGVPCGRPCLSREGRPQGTPLHEYKNILQDVDLLVIFNSQERIMNNQVESLLPPISNIKTIPLFPLSCLA